jgi:choline monooxygenase
VCLRYANRVVETGAGTNTILARARTLPSRLYTDPAVLDFEKERVFGRTWQLVGREEQVAEPGAYFTASVGDEPLLVVRGADGVLRALSNVCRHRAGPVASGEGRCRAFRCGYHGWSYSLDGRLLNTPEFEGVEDFDREAHGLPRFRAETWLGLVFVNLDPAAPPLPEALAPLPEALASRDLTGMRPAHRKDWEVACNWKVYVDNYLEGYHIPIVHPGLMQEIDYARYRTETFETASEQHSPIRAERGGPMRKEHPGDEARYFWIYPNLMVNVYPDNFSTNVILPLSHERTRTRFEWFFRDPDSAATRGKVLETVAFSDQIQLEDVAICEAVQKGLRSRTYDRGRYSVKRENGVHHFHRLIAAAMGDATSF